MPTPNLLRPNTTRIRNLVGFSAFIMLVFCVFVAFQGSRAYRQALVDGRHTAERLSEIMASHTELTFLGVDLSLRRAIERQYFNTLFGNNLPEYTEQNFKLWLDETPQIVALALINEHGEIEVAAHKKNFEQWIDYRHSLVGQKLFEQMRDADDNYVFRGKYVSPAGDTLIVVSRRFTKLNGEFGGMVLAAIDPKYFIDFYNSVAEGNEKYMSLMLADGTILATGPYTSIVTNELINEYLKKNGKPDSIKLAELENNGDNMKMMAIRPLKNIPIIVSAVVSEEDFLYGWRRSRIKDIGFLVLFTFFGSAMAYFAVVMAKQIMRVEESEGSAILASQAKSEFLANMSHELRTPLNAIIGFSEMINSGYFGPLNAKQKERIHDINLCGSHLLQLINDILEFSKGDAGKLELVEERVDIGEMVEECMRIMSAKIKGKGVTQALHIEPNLSLIWGDKRKIRQILLNLISNAIKFTPEGGIITASVKWDVLGNLNMIVSDTGIGIAEEDIPKALSVFGQVHRNKSHEGTGLGLPLCKMYAELHDGKLILTSRQGEGTTVRVVFPHQRTLSTKVV